MLQYMTEHYITLHFITLCTYIQVRVKRIGPRNGWFHSKHGETMQVHLHCYPILTHCIYMHIHGIREIFVVMYACMRVDWVDTNPHIYYMVHDTEQSNWSDLIGKVIATGWCTPNDVCWFIIPINYFV